jgi:FkbM family methyltransferase
VKDRLKRFAAQLTIDELARKKQRGIIARGKYKAITLLRRVLVAGGDPLISYRIGDNSVLMPLSHNLPLFQRDYHQYSENLGRIAAICAEKYLDMKVIDVGANIGDTAACVRKYVNVPVLCIEGDRKYFELLQQNAKTLGEKIEVELSFVYYESGEICGRMATSQGTGRLVLENEGETICARTLSEILNDHPEFSDARLIKIDTDGFDCKIIAAEHALLKSKKPVLFFEYDPYLCSIYGYEAEEVFESLRKAGYRYLVVYFNTGEFDEQVDLKNMGACRDLHQRYKALGSKGYADICALPGADMDLMLKIVEEEESLAN